MDHVFDAELYLWQDRPGSWLIDLPGEVSRELDALPRRGFGSVKVHVRIGDTTWDTSVFPSRGRGTHILPIKQAVRAAEQIEPGDVVRVSLTPLL